MIRENKMPVIPAAGRPVELAFDPSELLQTLEALAREYDAAVEQLRVNREHRARLQADIDNLDVEAKALRKKIHDPRLQGLLKRLEQLNRQLA